MPFSTHTGRVDLRTWIADEHASVLTRFEQSVGARVPSEMWKDPVGQGGSSIAYLVFHATFHEDLAVNAVLRGEPTVLAGCRRRLGLAAIPAVAGLGETEDPELTGALDVEALGDYVEAVHNSAQKWIESAPDTVFEAAADGPGGLDRAGIPEADVPWLYTMWAGKPTTFFLQWEAIGHRINHVGEMVSVRNRLGLSPF